MNEKVTYVDSLMTDPDLKTPLHDEIVIWCFNNTKTILSNFRDDKTCPVIMDKIIELPIFKLNRPNNYTNDKIMIGFIDLVVDIIDASGNERRVCIEVKSKILSLGDLIRQMQFYKENKNLYTHYIHDPIFIVVSPDVDKYSDILKSQGILPFKYAPQ